MSDPIRARLDELGPMPCDSCDQAEFATCMCDFAVLGDALRAVLDLCDDAHPDLFHGPWVAPADVRRAIADALGIES